MRKKGCLCALALLLLLLLTGCQDTPPSAQIIPGEPETTPTAPPAAQEAAVISELRSDEQTVALYYRLQGEDLLARETRTISLSNDYRLERMLIELLLEGPRASNLELTSLFPSNTRLIAITEQGTLLFVTLSQEFLSTPHDMPVNWRDDRALYEEVLTRRRLAMDSIVNTITESTGYTAVQLLIQQNVQEVYGQRIPRTEIYASETDSSLLFGPVYRSESMILTHYNTANTILTSWQQRQWDRLYRFVSSGEGRPTSDAFEQAMDQRQIALFSYSLSPGHVSADGQQAIFSVQLGISDAQGVHQIISSMPLVLTLEQDIWKISYETLVRLMQAAR